MKWHWIKSFLCALIIWGSTQVVFSQATTVTISPEVKRVIGGVSELDRSKFFKMHIGSGGSGDAEFDKLNEDYGVTGGRGFWGPFSFAKQKTGKVGVYPAKKSGDNSQRAVIEGQIATEHPRNVARYDVDVDVAAEWAAEYYMNHVNDRPEFFEPMNEPFVHADDDEFQEQQPDAQKMRVKMAEWFGAVGKKFHETPELANMKVIGYSSAWPSVELWDFGHWDTRMKMFMDVSGEHMDAFATHLYDGINVTGADNKRSGSNSEAILDLIEAYSYVKWKEVKPHAISEYGGIEKGYPASYSDAKSIQSIKSINHILFNLMEREDKMLISIPFITAKAQWHITEANDYEPYGAVLWRPLTITPTSNPNKPILGNWTYTARIRFFELWEGVEGERVLIKTDNPDIQVQAFRNDSKIHIALNNLDEGTQNVKLEGLANLENVQSINMRSLKIYDQEDPIYLDETLSELPESIEMISGETAILTIELSEPIESKNTIDSKKYYTDTHLATIVEGAETSFNFSGIEEGTGYATLRMSIGRKHERSKRPIVKVNGTSVHVPDNWKGYDQANRDDFFGMIEIPVSMNLISSDTKVSVVFPDSGGKISSMILQIEKFEIPVEIKEPTLVNQVKLSSTKVFPNPFHDSIRIETRDKMDEDNIEVYFYDLSGKQMQIDTSFIDENTIEIKTGQLTSGVYRIVVSSPTFRWSDTVFKN
ncbi:MAG: T9SS type A sorting domain-containing protein [Cyclobacteriaceae bacterium]